jgi:hypothetical protein
MTTEIEDDLRAEVERYSTANLTRQVLEETPMWPRRRIAQSTQTRAERVSPKQKNLTPVEAEMDRRFKAIREEFAR